MEWLRGAATALIGALIPTAFSYLKFRFEKRHSVFVELLFKRIEGNAEILREVANLYSDITDNFRGKPFEDAVREGQKKISAALGKHALLATSGVSALALDLIKTLYYFLPATKSVALT